MKKALLIFSFLIAFAASAMSQKAIYIECMDCEQIKKNCPSCITGAATQEWFTGVKISYNDRAPEYIYAPFSITSRGRTLYIESLTIKSQRVAIPISKTVYKNTTELALYLANCKGGGSGSGGGQPPTIDTNFSLSEVTSSINVAGNTEVCYTISDNVLGGSVLTFCRELTLPDGWDCQDTQDCLDGLVSIRSNTFPSTTSDSTSIETCITIGSGDEVCTVVNIGIPCEREFEEYEFTVANDLDNSFIVSAGALPTDPDHIWVWRNGKKYSFGTGYTYNAGTGEVNFSVVNTLATDHVTIREEKCKN